MDASAARLAEAVPAWTLRGEDAAVTGVADDTRRVTPGDLFVARGVEADKLPERLAAAAAAGAVAAVVPADAQAETSAGLALFRASPGVALDQAAAGRVADAFFDRPAAGLALVGVTGTNGKTTVATLTRHVLATLGVRTGLLGTVSVDTGAPGASAPRS